MARRLLASRLLLVGGLLTFLFLLAVAALGFLLFAPIPLPPLRQEALARTTHLYAADGSLLARWHGEINREPVPLGRISPYLQKAAVAAEDARFYSHPAVDAKATLRALVANLRAGRVVQGGSTITQQYVKDAYVGRKRSLSRKLREAGVALQLERRLSKQEILNRYLNMVYFGRGAYGAEAAAQTYFGKPASQLTLSESALLVGLIPAPVRYSPYERPEAAEARRLWVIDRMERVRLVSPATAGQGERERPALAPPTRERFPWFLDAVRTYLLKRYGESRVFAGGLEVYITLDPKLQEAAEVELAKSLPAPSDPHGALVSVDPETGYVRALVGGRDYGVEKFNIAIQGRRQPGSAFKPFVLVSALEKGMSPTARVAGATLEKGTIASINAVYRRLVAQVGPNNVVELAQRMGIPGPQWLPSQVGCRPRASPACRTHIQPVPALALGSEEVTPLEMASAFATLASGGVYREPKPVSKVVDPSGRVLEHGPSKSLRAIPREVADTATGILEKVITEGTGRWANIGRPAAGKTGTTNDFTNAWFVGYAPELSTSVWMGYLEANRPMVNVEGVPRVFGGTIPARIWAGYMGQANLAISGGAPAGPVLVGQELPYSFTVTNEGPWGAGQVSFTDALPPGVGFVSAATTQGECTEARRKLTCRLGDVPIGRPVTVRIVVRPTTPGTITNMGKVAAEAADSDPSNNAAPLETKVDPAADLSLTQSAPAGPVLTGQELTYTLIASNSGSSPASRVVLTDTLSGGVEFVSATSGQGTCSQAAGTVTCGLGELRAGARAIASITARLTVWGRITHLAEVAAAEADPNPANNALAGSMKGNPAADLSVVQSASPNPVLVGENLTYALAVANAGPAPATEVTLTDTLSPDATLVSATPSGGSCSQAGTTVVCRLGELARGAEASVGIVVRPTPARSSSMRPAGRGRLINVAAVTAREADPNPVNNTATTASVVNPAANLSVAQIPSPDPALLGDNVIYSATVTNSGPSPATGVTVADTLAPGVTFISAVEGRCGRSRTGGAVVCRIGDLAPAAATTIRLVVKPTFSGTFANTVEVSAREADPSPTDNTTTAETITLDVGTQQRRIPEPARFWLPPADLSIIGSASPNLALVGQDLIYTITIANPPGPPATGVTLTNTLPPGVRLVSATATPDECLQVARTVTCHLGEVQGAESRLVRIIVRPTASGRLLNRAEVRASEADPDASNNAAFWETSVEPSAELSIVQTALPNPALVGQNVTYVVTVENTGPSPASRVVLNETLSATALFVSATPSQGDCSEADGRVTCHLGALVNGGRATVTFVVRLLAPGKHVVVATVRGSETDPTPINTATTGVVVRSSANLSVVASAFPDPVRVGHNLTYELIVTNAGPSLANDVRLVGILPGDFIFVSASRRGCSEEHGTVSCQLGKMVSGSSATIEIVVRPTAPGRFVNPIWVTSHEQDPNPADNRHEVTMAVRAR